jgi:hypothetical protein
VEGKRKSEPEIEVENEEEEASQRGWFFCGWRQSSAKTARGVGREVGRVKKEGARQQ